MQQVADGVPERHWHQTGLEMALEALRVCRSLSLLSGTEVI